MCMYVLDVVRIRIVYTKLLPSCHIGILLAENKRLIVAFIQNSLIFFKFLT